MAIEVPDWYRTVALVGVDLTGEPVVVLLDSTGAIIAVMKGEYAGTLKNVAVDSAGRLIMIPTDPADVWGNAISMGNAELAVRLGYPGGFDDRGRVLFADSFEEGLSKGTTTKYGTLAAVEVSTSSSRLGAFSLKLTAGSDSTRMAGYIYTLPYPTLSKVGAQIAFTVSDDTEYIWLSYSFYDGSYRHTARIRYDHVNSKIQYADSALAWQDLISSVPLYVYPNAYHYLKVVIDLATAKYHRVLVDGYSWLVGGLGYYHALDATPPMFYCDFDHYGAVGKNAISYIDSVIFTQNEPA